VFDTTPASLPGQNTPNLTTTKTIGVAPVPYADCDNTRRRLTIEATIKL